MNIFTIDNNTLDFYLEIEHSREFVGQLKRSPEGHFEFIYDEGYLRGKHALSLGPHMAANRKRYRSYTLFPELRDRIPSRENKAYPEYCQQMGIAPDEQDEMILLRTLGKRGASRIVIEPHYVNHHDTAGLLRELMKETELSQHDLSLVLDIPKFSLSRIVTKKAKEGALVRLAATYLFHQEAFLDLLQHTGSRISPQRLQKLKAYLGGI